MTGFIIGIITAVGFCLLWAYANKNDIHPNWWQWTLTISGFLFAAFTLAVIAGFMAEDTPKAAAVMGILQGLPAIIWGVLIWRYVFKRAVTA